MLRYFYVKRQVFSSKKDFNLIDMIYKVSGHHIFMNANFKSEIVSGLESINLWQMVMTKRKSIPRRKDSSLRPRIKGNG